MWDADGNGQIESTDATIVLQYEAGLLAEPGYHPGFDRSAAPIGADLWDMGAPDGEIDLFTDIFGVAYQYGRHCTWAIIHA